MAVNLVSPGVSVREIDLTLGGIVGGSQNIGAIVGPFEKGPVNQPVLIENEQQLLQVFGKPQIADDQYEYWMSASNYLSYGGSLNVVRCSAATTALKNSYVAAGNSSVDLRIESDEDFQNNHTTDTEWIFASRNPGSWANNLKVCVIDNFADQIISGINTSQTLGFSTAISNRSGVLIGLGNTVGIDTSNIVIGQEIQCNTPGFISAGTTVTGISSSVIVLSTNSLQSATLTNATFNFGTAVETSSPLQVGFAVTQPITNQTIASGIGTTSFSGYLRGVITGVGNSQVSVKITDRVDTSGNSTDIEYSSGITTSASAFTSSREFKISSSSGVVRTISQNSSTVTDWYDSQTINLTNSTIFWRTIAEKPGTSQYALEKSSKNDEIHVVVIDDEGKITGTSGILERHLNLSKATDAKLSPSQAVYYKDYITQGSNYIYHGAPEAGVSGNIDKTTNTATSTSAGTWGTLAQSKVFNVIGNKTYTLTGGKDYSGTSNVGGYSVTNSDVINGYNLFKNTEEFSLNYLIGGPSGGPTIFDAQAKANAIIAVAEERKDCVATISPYKSGVVNVSNSNTQTQNVIEFFNSLTSSSYVVFDSGYKYTLDRFNNRFVYIPCNSDVAGIMVRTAVNNYPWFSPAGTARGALLNTIKLAYNPSQAQRDQLYSKRINPIISSPNSGFILFGDKTGLGYKSAFDRINVRMLFLTIERTIELAARNQLFEFNDAITRSNFVNIVEPYLRDVRAKRGITEFIVICDESNNTPEVIDANEFRAEIFVKPSKSINYVGLTFVATRTGISFSEVVGTV